MIIYKMTIITCLSIITLKVNELNSNQKTQNGWMEKEKKKTHVYTAYKIFTSDIEIHRG